MRTLKHAAMLWKASLAALFIAVANPAYAVDAQSLHEADRGDLLYSTYCIACHSTQVHWREKKLVTDWTTLRSQVRRWQGNAGLGWSNQDIARVAQYLNALYYHYPKPD